MRSGVIGPATRGLLGFLAFVFAANTAKWFPWTIEEPLSAAVIGANYWASTLLAVLAAREALWANGRISISVALIFSPLMAAATFIHFDQFHTDSSGITLIITWFWIVAYGLYPIQLGVQLTQQLRTPGGDPPRTNRLPMWVKVVLGVQAAVLIPLGLLMYIAPGSADTFFPWPLSDLTSRALAAWTLAFGGIAAHAIWEDDFARVRVAMLGYPFLVALQVIAVARFPDNLEWGSPTGWGFIAFLVSCTILGAWGWMVHRRATAAEPAAPAANA
jgi:hypothetical protein